MPIHPFYLRHPVAAALHLGWCLWSAYVTVLLWRLTRGDPLKRATCLVFGVSAVVLYAASGVYHSIPADRPSALEAARLIDHSAIYLLIAGTYTPFFAVLLRGPLRPALLGLLWGLAGLGIACKWLLPAPSYPLTVALYVGMGWAGLLGVPALVRAVGTRATALAVAGGLFYTSGAVWDAVGWPVPWPGVFGPHEALHVCDIAGTLTHVIFVFRYVLPYRL